MTTLTFDTLNFTKRLKSAGFTEEQAEALSEVQKTSLSEVMDNSLATKGDVAVVRQDLESLRRDMKEMELRLTVKIGAFMATAVGLVAALLKLL